MVRMEDFKAKINHREVNRQTLRHNLEVFGIGLPKKLTKKGEPTHRAVNFFLEEIPQLVTDYLLAPNLIGLSVLYVQIDRLRQSLPGCTFSQELERLLKEKSQKGETIEELSITDQPISKLLYVSNEMTRRIKDISDEEKMSRRAQINHFLEAKGENGTYTALIVEWLAGKLNDIFNHSQVYSFDLVHPPQVNSRTKDASLAGTFELSNLLGVSNNLGLGLVRTINDAKSLDSLETDCEKNLGPILMQIKERLEVFDNPDSLVLDALKTVRYKTKKNFLPAQNSK